MNTLLLFETDHYKIFLNEDDQYYLGRSVILLKREAPNLSDIKPEEWVDLGLVIRIFENALKKSFNATNFNWTCTLNSAYLNNVPNVQVYWHVRPRYKNAIKFKERIFKDNLFGKHYQSRHKVLLSSEFNKLIANEIRNNINNF